MEYKITIFNTITVIFIIYLIVDYAIKNNDAGGLGMLLIIYALVAGLGLLVVDFIIQYFLKEYWKVLLVEGILVGILALWVVSTQREKVLLLPKNFAEGEITIIYGMEGADKLPISFFTWRYKVQIPESGVLLTSTKFEDDLPQTDFKTHEGSALDNELSAGCLYENEMGCGTKKYKYRTWIVQKGGCEFSSVKADSMQVLLEKQYCK